MENCHDNTPAKNLRRTAGDRPEHRLDRVNPVNHALLAALKEVVCRPKTVRACL
jgi:hypothetical protein